MEAKDPQACAERLRKVRNLANLSRQELCAESGVNIHTLSGWENGRFGGLSRPGAQKIIQFLATKGVKCSLEWLLFEIGASPTLQAVAAELVAVEIPEISNEEQHIIDELMLFKNQYHYTLDMKVVDDSMLPWFEIDDYVAGVVCHTQHLQRLYGRPCIAQTRTNQLLLRMLQPGSGTDKFSLICSNLQTNTAQPVLQDVDWVRIAPVLWHRKPTIEH